MYIHHKSVHYVKCNLCHFFFCTPIKSDICEFVSCQGFLYSDDLTRETACVNLIHLFSCFPFIHIYYLYFAFRLILEMDTLFIPNVEPEDQGVYTCVGSTTLDIAMDDTRITVLGMLICVCLHDSSNS